MRVAARSKQSDKKNNATKSFYSKDKRVRYKNLVLRQFRWHLIRRISLFEKPTRPVIFPLEIWNIFFKKDDPRTCRTSLRNCWRVRRSLRSVGNRRPIATLLPSYSFIKSLRGTVQLEWLTNNSGILCIFLDSKKTLNRRNWNRNRIVHRVLSLRASILYSYTFLNRYLYSFFSHYFLFYFVFLFSTLFCSVFFEIRGIISNWLKIRNR